MVSKSSLTKFREYYRVIPPVRPLLPSLYPYVKPRLLPLAKRVFYLNQQLFEYGILQCKWYCEARGTWLKSNKYKQQSTVLSYSLLYPPLDVLANSGAPEGLCADRLVFIVSV